MRKLRAAVLAGIVVLLAAAAAAWADDAPAAGGPSFTREEVIYGRKYGTALTMDVFRPRKDANGAAVVVVVSGGWFSSHDAVNPGMAAPFLGRGYTVFAVVHGSQPKFSIPEILGDMHRAVRFIRHHAKNYGIDPDRIGITGGSAGGHLSLMQGCAGDAGDPKAKDPVDRVSSRVQAVACFYPPTDFLNWGEQGKPMLGNRIKVPVKGAFDFRERDPKNGSLVPVEVERVLEIGREISPIYHVRAGVPPTLIVHGDADDLVPVQQARVMEARLKEAGVTAKLIVKPGGKHDGALVQEFLPEVLGWFDKHLAKKEAPAAAGK
jgi:acetyl esterase/lipase